VERLVDVRDKYIILRPFFLEEEIGKGFLQGHLRQGRLPLHPAFPLKDADTIDLLSDEA